MGVSNYTPTGISHATSVDFSKRSVNQPVHIVQYDRSLPILAVSLYNNGQLYRLSETMEVSIRLGKPDRTFVYNKALGCDSTRTIVYFEITQQMSLFDGEFYPVIEIMDGEKIANSSTIYLVVDRNPVQHDYIESTVEYKELIDYRDDAVKAGNEAKEAAKVASDSAKTVVEKTKDALEASETAVNAANSASTSAESIIGVEENVTRIGNMVSEKEPIITAAAETASTSSTNAKQSETNAKASEEASKLSETNAKESETNAKASEEASKLSETNAKNSENKAKESADSAKVSETNAKSSADSIEEIAKASESYAHGGTNTREGEDTDNARYYMEQAKAVSAVDIATTEKAGIVKPDGTTITVDEDGTLRGQSKVDEMTGATADKDGTSGTVPAPTAGQEKLFLRGDGTWAEAEQDLSAYYNNANYDTENNKLQLMNGDTVLKEIEISGGGGTKISPKATVNPAIRNGNAKVTITWGDPEDVVADGVILSAWKGTKLVMKETGYPENENDGIVLADNKTKNAYASTGYEVTGLTNGNTYYFKLFPYSTDGIYNYQDSNKLLGNPSLVKLDSCTNMSLSLAMGSVTVSWTDPDAEKTVDENTATWSKTVLVYKQGSTAPSSISDGIVAVEETTRNQYSVDGFTVDGLTDGEQYSFALFAVSTEGVSSDATTATANLWATLTITTGETKLYGKEVTATYGSSTVSGTFNSTGSATLQIPWIGETTITSTDGTDTATSVVTISAYGSTYSVDLSFLKIVTFADGTDEEIAAMVNAHYNDKINIADYWAVGDTRSVSLSAMSATGVGESHRAQTVQFVIGDFEHDDLATPINGHSKAAITLLQKDCLMDASNAANPTNGSGNTENGYMNSSNTNSGGWKSCARRTWCNNVFFAALPSAWQSMVKTVNKKSGTVGGSSSGTEVTEDKIFLAAEIEILGSTNNSVSGEGTQYQYYKNATANRYKMPKWAPTEVSNIYWERSPIIGSYSYFYCLDSGGNPHRNNADVAIGVAPCLCI